MIKYLVILTVAMLLGIVACNAFDATKFAQVKQRSHLLASEIN